MDATKELMEELALDMDYWVNKFSESLKEHSDLSWTDHPDAFIKIGEVIRANNMSTDIESVVCEILRGYIHTVLTVFDGGSKLADKVLVTVVDEQGQPLGPGLHERFVDHLLETERL